MKREFRLRDQADFQRVWEVGRSWAHPWVVLRARPNQLPYTRCGFVAGKKLGTAIVRNRAKRRLREALRLQWRSVTPGHDLVWIARPGLAAASFAEIVQAVQELLRRADLWQAEPALSPAAPAPDRKTE